MSPVRRLEGQLTAEARGIDSARRVQSPMTTRSVRSRFVDVGGVQIGQGGIDIGTTVGGIPIDINIPIGRPPAPEGGGTRSFQPEDAGRVQQCTPPTIFDPASGVCLMPGSPGEISVTDVTDVSVPDVSMGVFGFLSTQPVVVGQTSRGPMLRCPHPGLVLGKDNRCYSKKDLPLKARKWRPHKCKSTTDKRLDSIEKAGRAAKALKKKFKGTGLKLVKAGR